MTDDAPAGFAAAEDGRPDLTDGRYLYSVVSLGDTDDELQVTGVDDEPVTVVADADGGSTLGAIVHRCDALYDAADPRIVRQWLVQHQRVVDEATETFGTPIPFQFDTIVRGGDDAVAEWLAAERDALRTVLDDVAGANEYRIEVRRTEPIPADEFEATDGELADLRNRIDDATEGTAHLLEKQYEGKLSERRRERDRRLASSVRERIDGLVSRLEVLDRRPSVTLGDARNGSDAESGQSPGEGTAADEDGETGEPVCRFALLATDDAVDDVGSILDTVADREGITVRFTGPWPPYSFVPSFDGADDETEGP
ncbi:gas vesicle protein GvpL [Halovivax cerinus]|uniref:Gas vesicle protein GvpL n=1 Tax=Halovivax cerinus TaxID=1487865 RepID=A0ABD5NPI1_9EURY|nr:GvpL/GvpF family gas vesicle protein [Halovivax cerinus]